MTAKTDIDIASISQKIEAVKEEMKKAIIGQDHLVKRLVQTLMVRGHILLEGVPGLAKTTAITTLAQICKVDFHRIQFTPDLLPSDVIGNQIFNPKTQEFEVKKGPVFHNFVLADEINRSPAKVQSALLEAMQERQVTIGDKTHQLPKPFFVLATQNPIDQEGTFPLPEAQMDRFFFKVILDYPTLKEEQQIIQRVQDWDKIKIKPVISGKEIEEFQKIVSEVFIDERLLVYITNLVEATRFPDKYGIEGLEGMLAYGASPRASINFLQGAKASAIFEGRDYVMPEDIKGIAADILRHRVMPSFEAQAEGRTSEELVSIVLDAVKIP